MHKIRTDKINVQVFEKIEDLWSLRNLELIDPGDARTLPHWTDDETIDMYHLCGLVFLSGYEAGFGA
jgi:hypothetical protein